MTNPAGVPGERRPNAFGAGTDAPSGIRRVPFGVWPSPLSATIAARGGTRFGGLVLSRDRAGRALVWFSVLDGGRNTLWVTRPDGSPRRIEAVISARSRVNEYGGGAFWAHGVTLFWVEDEDQRIRRLDLGGEYGCLVDRRPGDGSPDVSAPLTVAQTGHGTVLVDDPPAHRSTRYAAGVVEPGGAWMVTERELHVDPSDPTGSPLSEAVNDLVWLPTGSAEGHPTSTLRSGVHRLVGGSDTTGGSDFVAAPTLAPNGSALAWLQWDHPDMPWDSAELCAGRLVVGLDGPVVEDVRRVAGGTAARPGDQREPAVSVCLPMWDPQGRLWWCDDRDDLWMLRRMPEPGLPCTGAGDQVPAVEPGEPGGVRGANRDTDGEFGAPRWVSGGGRYGFEGHGVVAVRTAGGLDGIVGSGPAGSRIIESPGWVDILVVGPTVDAHGAEGFVMAAVAGSPTEPTAVVCVHAGAATSELSRFARRPWPLGIGSISVPESITFPTAERGDVLSSSRRAVAHGLFYPPLLEGVAGPLGDLPPLIVRIHGGPTAHARAELSSSVQFWTTRGFAVVEVNYRGSTGYGRTYRDQLRGGWGEVEVQDCIAAAEFLAHEHRVDARRCVIRGGSAGGFTALEAVAAEPTASGFHFAAATTLYGVTDLMALADDTHKFESRYLDGLVGPLPGAEALYRKRSPLHHPERISSPVLVLQGLDDPVVPPSQAEVLVAALAEAGIDHEYRTYEGEGHGFRNEATIVDAMKAELAFYQRVLALVTGV